MRLHLDEPAHADALVRLNEAWIRACFRLEDFDHAFARDPMRIVRDGGALLTLARGRQVVGGCALLREDPHRFRLEEQEDEHEKMDADDPPDQPGESQPFEFQFEGVCQPHGAEQRAGRAH